MKMRLSKNHSGPQHPSLSSCNTHTHIHTGT